MTALARRPAVAAAAIFIIGIGAHGAFVTCGFAYAIICLVSALAALLTLRGDRLSDGFIAMSLFSAGIAAAQLSAFYFPRDDVSAYATDRPRLARVELLIDQPLRIITNQFNAPRPLPPRQVTSAKVLRVLTTAGWRDASGRILVQLDPPRDDLRLGQRIGALGMLQRPSPAMNPGQFDWAEYYREQRILASIQIPQSDAIAILADHGPSPLAKLRESVRTLLARGFPVERSLDHALLRALVLGDHDPELRDVQEQFRRTGTSHHLAISGMHVTVLGGVVFLICRLLRRTPRTAVILALAAVVFYGVVALPSPPVVRSMLLCIAVATGMLLKRRNDPIQLLALSVLAMLIYHPLDLYNAGFQLSFGTVLGLMMLTRRLTTMLEDEHARVALLCRHEGRVSRRVVWRERVKWWVAPPILASVVAWVVSLPLIAFHFEQLNPWAVFASVLLAVPVLLSLIAGFVKIILTALLPFGASWWASAAGEPVALMRWSVDALATLPKSDVPLPAHSISLVVIYYALLCLPLLPIRWPKLRRSLRLAPGAALALLVMLPLTGGAARIGDGSLRVHVLAIGAGQCCLVEMPDGNSVMLDAGSTTLADPVRKCIAPFLRHRGRAGIDEVWLSHGDYDHLSAAAEILRTYGVRTVRFSDAFERLAANDPPDQALLATMHDKRVEIQRIARGQRVDLGSGVVAESLWPPADSASLSSNDSGLVLKLTYARRTILFPADIEHRAQAELLRAPDALRCDVLLAPHHGSFERTTAAFIAAADPLYIVSSNDRTLSQKQRTFARQIGDRALFRTNECGAIEIRIDKTGGLTVTPFIPPRQD